MTAEARVSVVQQRGRSQLWGRERFVWFAGHITGGEREREMEGAVNVRNRDFEMSF